MYTRTLTRDEILEVINAAPKSTQFGVGISSPHDSSLGHGDVRLRLVLSNPQNHIYFRQLQAIRVGYSIKEFKVIVEQENRELRNYKRPTEDL